MYVNMCLCVVEVSKAVAREIRMMQSGKGSLNMEGMSHYIQSIGKFVSIVHTQLVDVRLFFNSSFTTFRTSLNTDALKRPELQE